jgi:hypothetical protein
MKIEAVLGEERKAEMIGVFDPEKKRFQYYKNSDGHFVCPICKKVTENQHTMHYHYKNKHQNTPKDNMCTVCGKKFIFEKQLQNHMISKHEAKAESMICCPARDCAFKSLTKGNCLIHYVREHLRDVIAKYEIPIENTKKIQCGSCMKVCESGTSFKYHISKCLITQKLVEDPLLTQLYES